MLDGASVVVKSVLVQEGRDAGQRRPTHERHVRNAAAAYAATRDVGRCGAAGRGCPKARRPEPWPTRTACTRPRGEQVQKAAEELNFRPNAIARNLFTGTTGTVGVLTNDLDGRFAIPILAGAEDALGAGKISVMLCDARGDAIREQQHLKTLLERRIDGLIVVGGAPHRSARANRTEFACSGRLRVRTIDRR